MSRRVLFVFDTTGSMSRWIESVRQNVGSLATRILDEDRDCEVGFLAYGDYCDGAGMIQDSTNPDYVYAHEVPLLDRQDLPDLAYTYSGNDIERWLSRNRSTGGGDHPECVEFVLRYLRVTHIPSAQAGDHHLIIFWIGDAPPHEDLHVPGLSMTASRYLAPRGGGGLTGAANVHGLDWQEELNAIAPSGTVIYTALCGNDADARRCWEQMSSTTGGISVDINNIDNLANTMIAVVKRETGQLDEFAAEVREGGADAEMEEILVDLGATCND